jgi:hypothetical protein
MLAATERANIRLDEIGTELEHAALENVLAPGRCRERGGIVGDPGPVVLSRPTGGVQVIMAGDLTRPDLVGALRSEEWPVRRECSV